MIRKELKTRPDRVEFELRMSGVKPGQERPLVTGVHTRGYLPHVKREGASYFVTFRLVDSLPTEVLMRIKADHAQQLTAFYAQKQAAEKTGDAGPSLDRLREIERAYFSRLEAYLDKGAGACWLKRPEAADIVAGALRYFDSKRYQLKAWVVMPNHVHVVVWPMPNHSLSSILKSWKLFTAREANEVLGRTGQPFWQPEAYDHWIRDNEELARCCSYVVNNPVKARLCSDPKYWKWSSAYVP
jgi:REP element-mobilizing transposase RayT